MMSKNEYKDIHIMKLPYTDIFNSIFTSFNESTITVNDVVMFHIVMYL